MTRPTLIIVSGPPGSGKSTLATRLSQHLGLPHCARDAIKQGQAWHNAPLMETPQDAQLACNHAFREMVSLLLCHDVSHVCDAGNRFSHTGNPKHVSKSSSVLSTTRYATNVFASGSTPNHNGVTHMLMLPISPLSHTTRPFKHSTPTTRHSW